MDIAYRCPFCQHGFSVRVPGYKVDPEWDEKQPRLPQRRCPACGAASAPAAWLDERMGQLWGREDEFYQHWSNCRNASVCSLHDAYQGDCENGVLMPKCLQTIQAAFQSLLRRLPAGKPKESGAARRKARDKPGPESESSGRP